MRKVFRWLNFQIDERPFFCVLVVLLMVIVPGYAMLQSSNNKTEATVIRLNITTQEIKANAKERKHQICQAEIEDRVLIEDILNFVSQNNSGSRQIDTSQLPEALRQLIEQSRANQIAFNEFANERLDIPPDICAGTGLTEALIRQQQEEKRGDPDG